MSDLLQATGQAIGNDVPSAEGVARERGRHGRARVAVFLVGLAAVVAVAVSVAADDSSDPPRTSQQPPAPFVTTDVPPGTGGYNGADG